MSLIKKSTELEINPKIKALIYGQPGCLSAETIISARYGNVDKKLHLQKIEHAYKRQEGIDYTGNRGKNKDRGDLYVRSLNENTLEFEWSKAIVLFSGKKQCYKLTSTTGKSIETTEDHPFLTENGWKKLSELSIGDKIYYKPNKRQNKGDKKRLSEIREVFVKYHPANRKKEVNGHSYFRVYLHHFVFEANKNNLTFEEYKEVLNNYDGRELFFIPKGYEIDHIDGNRNNNDVSNLQMLTKEEHSKKTYQTAEVFSKYIAELAEIVSIEKTEIKDTYDIHCIEGFHNFCANNYVVHNTGKSTLAISAPKPLLFDFDGGVHRVNFSHLKEVDIVQISDYQNFIDVLDKEDLRPYETLVIDTGGKLLDFMGEYIVKRNSKMGRANGMLTLQGYGERKAMFSALIKKVSIMNKHLVFVAHRQTEKDGEDTRYVPLFGGSNYDSLVTELDLVGYLEAQGRKRTITFDPTSRNDGKNTCNLPALIEIPIIVNENGDSIAPNDFLTEKVIKPYIQRIESRKAQSVEYDKLVEELRFQIGLITDELSANDFVKRINDFNHVGSSKVMAGKLLQDHITKLGLKWNKESESYEKVQDISVPA